MEHRALFWGIDNQDLDSQFKERHANFTRCKNHSSTVGASQNLADLFLHDIVTTESITEIMKYTARLLIPKTSYTRPIVVLPQPYKLFHKSLLTGSELNETRDFVKKHKWQESPPIEGFELFRQAMGLGTDPYVQSLWDKLSENQRQTFVKPPPKVYEDWLRISQGYEDASKVLAESPSENPYFNTQLYPWEIIKDKLRNKPVFAADIYDQLIHEVMNPPKYLFRPGSLYENYRTYFKEPDEWMLAYKYLTEEEKAEYVAVSKQKNSFLRRKDDYRRAKGSFLKGYDVFTKEYSREIGDLISEPEKTEFIKQQWQQEKLVTLVQRRQATLREISLETQLAMIMDYIFEYNTVENCNVDWRQWRQHVSGNYHYLDRLLFPYVVNVWGDKIEFHESLPTHLQWLPKTEEYMGK